MKTCATRVSVLVATSALVLMGCGADATTTAADTSAVCEDRLSALVEQLRADVAYDYEPTQSPGDLATRAGAVVTGSLADVGQDGDNVVAVIGDAEVISGDTSVVENGDVVFSWYVGPEQRDVGDYDGISVLAFLLLEGATPTPEIEGLWFGCGLDGPARSMIVEPVETGWPAGPDATIANLEQEVAP